MFWEVIVLLLLSLNEKDQVKQLPNCTLASVSGGHNVRTQLLRKAGRMTCAWESKLSELSSVSGGQWSGHKNTASVFRDVDSQSLKNPGDVYSPNSRVMIKMNNP